MGSAWLSIAVGGLEGGWSSFCSETRQLPGAMRRDTPTSRSWRKIALSATDRVLSARAGLLTGYIAAGGGLQAFPYRADSSIPLPLVPFRGRATKDLTRAIKVSGLQVRHLAAVVGGFRKGQEEEP
jgi:hypothetical protein